MTKATTNDPYFEGENTRPQKEYFPFEKIGDKITGVYIGKIKNDIIDRYGKKKMEYIFKTNDGYKFVSGRNLRKGEVQGVDYCVLFPMLSVKPGTVMGLKYTEDKDSGKGNPIKIIDDIYPNEPKMEESAIEEFNKELGMFYNLETSTESGGEDNDDLEETNVDDIPFVGDEEAKK